MHNSIFRGYNSIYHQALHVVDADRTDFICYCLTWHKFVIAHAENEETSLFVRVETLLDDSTIFEESHKEHGESKRGPHAPKNHIQNQSTHTAEDAFMPGLQEFHDYLKALKSPQDFSGARLLSIMAGFQETFESHFRAEIATIAKLAEHPKTLPPGSKEELAVTQDFDSKEGKALIGSGLMDVVPFFLFNMDREFEDGLWKDWPPIPKPVRWALTRGATLFNSGCWRFASCDSDGRPRELYAVPRSG
jgi:hypothetical protein